MLSEWKKGPFFAPSERIDSIKAKLFATPCSICLERPTLMKEFLSSSEGRIVEGEHPLVRRAKILEYIYSNRKPVVYAGELIIGNMTSKRIAANYYPEGGSVNILEDIFRLEKRRIPLHLTNREKLKLAKIGVGGIFSSVGGKALLSPGRISHFFDFFVAKRYFITEEAGIGHQVGGYRSVVHHGLRKADERARECIWEGKTEDGKALDEDKKAFYLSVRIVIAGIRKMAENLAMEAERIAALPETSDRRGQELLECAAACRRAPYEPARTFQEGLQACWLVHIAMNLEDFEQGMSFGRLDQILWPLFKKDLEKGRLTPEKAAEMLASFGLKTCETIPLYSERIDQYFSGNAVAQGITIGGTDEKGRDTTNDLSGLILDSYAQLQTREPALHVRVHRKTPRWFIDKAVEVVQLGCGKPSFFGDEKIVEALENAGIEKAHARDYGVIGCVELASQGRTYNSSDAALFNLPLCLELALNEGNRLLGIRWPGKRFGARTPSPSSMMTFEDVVDAFRVQVKDAVDEMVMVIGWLEKSYKIRRSTPVNSIITEGCLASGRDVTWGGAMYDFTSIQVAGVADAGDSLYALKKIVFDEKRYSLDQYVEILRNNFQGHEKLRAELSNKFAKYGNEDPEADAMTQLAADIFAQEITANRNSRGGKYIAGIYSMTCHLGFGKITGALPNGRLAGKRLSNGLSPADGFDRQGPTAVLNSVASFDSINFANCYALNLKFDKKTVSGESGKKTLSSLVRGYFDQGGMQVQFNVLDADMLRAAKDDPSLYPSLVVRVAGYCSYFNDLQPAVQDEIIERTSHGI